MLEGITCGDCVELMASLDADSLDLVVTSPPYFNAREYAQWPTYQNYLEWCAKWIEQAASAGLTG